MARGSTFNLQAELDTKLEKLSQQCVILTGFPAGSRGVDINELLTESLENSGLGPFHEDREIISNQDGTIKYVILLFSSNEGLQLASALRNISLSIRGYQYEIPFLQCTKEDIPPRWAFGRRPQVTLHTEENKQAGVSPSRTDHRERERQRPRSQTNFLEELGKQKGKLKQVTRMRPKSEADSSDDAKYFNTELLKKTAKQTISDEDDDDDDDDYQEFDDDENNSQRDRNTYAAKKHEMHYDRDNQNVQASQLENLPPPPEDLTQPPSPPPPPPPLDAESSPKENIIQSAQFRELPKYSTHVQSQHPPLPQKPSSGSLSLPQYGGELPSAGPLPMYTSLPQRSTEHEMPQGKTFLPSHTYHTINSAKGRKLQATQYVSETKPTGTIPVSNRRTIEVSGFRSPISDAELEVYFGKPRKSGGGDIENIRLDPTRGKAYVTFEEEKVAANVLGRDHVLKGQKLKLKEYVQEEKQTSGGTVVDMRKIQVSGFDSSISEADLELYFSKPKKSGGGEIETVEIDEKKGTAYILFEEDTDAANVLKKQHVLKGLQLQVKLHAREVKSNTDTDGKSIEVWGFDSSISDADLEVYFGKPKRSGGGEVEEVKMDENKRRAYITFEDEEIAANVLRRDHKLKGQILQLKEYVQEFESAGNAGVTDGNIIEVWGYDSTIGEADLELYFGKPKKSCGGEIVEIKMDEDTGRAYITFEEAKVAANVLGRDHVLKGQKLQLKEYVKDEEQTSDETVVDKKKIQVWGFDSSISEADLELYFSKPKKSGGGEIETIEIDEEKMIAYITYEDKTDAANVLERDHVLKRQKLKTAQYVQEIKPTETTPASKGKTIEVWGFGSSISDAELEVYFGKPKKSGGGEIEEIRMDQNRVKAYITFEDEKVAENVLGRDHVMKGQRLQLKLYVQETWSAGGESAVNKKIKVSGFDSSVSEADLELYFSKPKKSGGGEIEQIEMDEVKNIAYITFEEETDAFTVLKNKHVLKEQELQVKAHTEDAKPQYNTKTIEVCGLSRSTTEADLELYFGKKSRSGGGEVTDVMMNDKKRIAYITFQEEEIAQRVLKKKHTLKGSSLQIKQLTAVTGQENLPAATPKLTPEEMESVRTIEVSGFGKDIDKDQLELYFERKRQSDGGSVAKVKLMRQKGMALVTFEEAEVAQRVVQRTHRINGNTLTVKLRVPKEKPGCCLEVRGFPPSLPISKLELYFEKTRLSGGGSVKTFNVNERKGVAYVTFEEKDVATRVLSRKHGLEGSVLEVNPYESDDDEDTNDTAEIDKILEVRRLPPGITEDKIEVYFSKQKVAGGSDVVNVELDVEQKKALVTFDSGEGVNAVLASKHQLQGTPVEVRRYVPPPPVPKHKDKVFIKGVGPSTTKDLLSNFLGAKTHIRPSDFVYGKDKDTVLVTFETELDIKQLQADCKSVPLGGCYLQVSEVPISHSLIAYFENAATTKDDFQFYFENPLSSGGGPVQTITMNDEELFCVVTFKSIEDVQRVLQRKHSIEEQEIRVFLYMECIGREYGSGCDESFFLPPPQTLDHVDKYKYAFLRQSKEMRGHIDQKMLSYHANVHWPNTSQEAIKLECTLDRSTKGYRRIAKDWLKVSKQEMESCVAEIEVNSVPVDQSMWANIVAEIPALTDITQDKALIIPDEDTCNIIIVGEKGSVSASTAPIGQRVKELEEELSRQKQQMQKTMHVKGFQLHYLMAQSFIESVESNIPGLKVKVIEDKEQLTFKGLKQEIQEAQLEMYDIINSLCTKSIDLAHEQELSLFSADETKKYINGMLENKSISCVWEISDSKIDVHGCPERLVNAAAETIRTSVVECKVVVAPETGAMLSSDLWKRRKAEIESECSGKAHVVVDNLCVRIFVTDDIATMVRKQVNQFFSSNEILEDQVSYTTGVEKYISTYHQKEIRDITVDLSSECVEVRMCPGEKGILIHGTKNGILEAKKRISTLAKQIKTKQHQINKPGIQNYINSPKGKQNIEFVESKTTTIIEVKTDGSESNKPTEANFDSTQRVLKKTTRRKPARETKVGKTVASGIDISTYFHPDTSPTGAEAFPGLRMNTSDQPSGQILDDFGNISVSIVKGELASQKVDCIVNTTSRSLDLKSGRVSKSILQAGGQVLQDECNQKYPNGLRDVDIAVTGPGNLPCKMVCHGTLSGWDGGEKCIPNLKELMKQCLEETDEEKYTSIAFPALGTGNLRYPRDVVAREMFRTVRLYGTKILNTCITAVFFVIYDKDIETLEAFAAEEESLKRGIDTTPKITTTSTAQEFISQGKSFTRPVASMDDIQGQSTTILGSVKVHLYQGDITDEDADCIVNSTNENMDMSGAVATKLVSLCGSDLQAECNRKQRDLREKGLITSNAPRLKCRRIIHVVAEFDKHSWKTAIGKCLLKAEEEGMTSVAFPALGTNSAKKNVSARDIAEAIFEAIHDFQSRRPKYVCEVRVVIFQADMVPVFAEVARNYVDLKQEKGLFVKMGQMISGLMGMSTPRPRASTSSNKGNEVGLTIYYKHEHTLKEATDRLANIVETEIDERTLYDDAIRELTEDEITQIQQVEDHCNVYIDVKKEAGEITIKGMLSGVIEALNKIHKEVGLSKDSRNMFNRIQWHYIEITEDAAVLTKYDQNLNLLIEKTFQSQESTLEIYESDGTAYVLDFNKMVEYPKDNPADEVQLIRRDVLKDAAKAELPVDWAPMKETDNMLMTVLKPSDPKFTEVTSMFQHSCGGDKKIIKIERIQNRMLYQQYTVKKNTLVQQYPGEEVEMILWHGTSVDSIDSIKSYGFNRSYCGKNATAYGHGVYFAKEASYSAGGKYSPADGAGNKRVFMCRVLVGKSTLGDSSMKVPPKKGNGYELYDSVVNTLPNPTIVVIFNDTQAYPEYLITFTQ